MPKTPGVRKPANPRAALPKMPKMPAKMPAAPKMSVGGGANLGLKTPRAPKMGNVRP